MSTLNLEVAAALNELKITAHSLEGVDDCLLLTPLGTIRSTSGEQFRSHVDQLLEQTAVPSLVIDFGGVDYIDSSTAGYLLKVHDRLSTKGGKLALAGLHAAVRVVIDSIGLTTFFTVCETVEEAVHEIGS